MIVIFAFTMRAAYTGGTADITGNLVGIIAEPFQKISSEISGSVREFFDVFIRAKDISNENEELKKKIGELNRKLVDYDQVKRENENLKEFLEIKERNPEFEFEMAAVIGKDPNSKFHSFTINKGTLNGVELRDVVITPEGLVGVISEVGLTYSKVTTVLDASLEIGSYISSTRDVGVVTGRISEAEKGHSIMTLLPKKTEAKPGDIVLTSGLSGGYPHGIIIGEIIEIKDETHGLSKYAVIKPAADVRDVKDVLVIKSFLGEDKDGRAPSRENPDKNDEENTDDDNQEKE